MEFTVRRTKFNLLLFKHCIFMKNCTNAKCSFLSDFVKEGCFEDLFKCNFKPKINLLSQAGIVDGNVLMTGQLIIFTLY